METLDGWALRKALKSVREDGITEFTALRRRAFVLLHWSTGLLVDECVDLDVDQIVRVSETNEPFLTRTFSLRANQNRRGAGGEFTFDAETSIALEDYLTVANLKGWMGVERWEGPLFITSKAQGGRSGHGRVGVRTMERALEAVQASAGIEPAYSFHALRYDAILRHRGTLAEKARFGRISKRDAARHVDDDPDGFGAALARIEAAYDDGVRARWTTDLRATLVRHWRSLDQGDAATRARCLAAIKKELPACWNGRVLDSERVSRVVKKAGNRYLKKREARHA